jgi:hypothetical protein
MQALDAVAFVLMYRKKAVEKLGQLPFVYLFELYLIFFDECKWLLEKHNYIIIQAIFEIR